MSTTPNPAAPSISVENVSKFFGRFAALLQVNAEFRSGNIYALLGGNGSGKSTLLRIIAGLSQPTSGRIVHHHLPASRIGYMAHASLLYDEMSGLENLQYFAALYGLQSRDACSSAMARVDLDPALPRLLCDYSQGMRQRLSLARAIIHDPQVILLDEPFSNVDAISASRMVSLLSEMKYANKLIVVVTHQPELLRNIASETVTLEAGRIKSSMTPGVREVLA